MIEKKCDCTESPSPWAPLNVEEIPFETWVMQGKPWWKRLWYKFMGVKQNGDAAHLQ